MSAAILLALAALLHLIRFVFGWKLMLGVWELPVWSSIIIIILAGYFSISLWKIANK